MKTYIVDNIERYTEEEIDDLLNTIANVSHWEDDDDGFDEYLNESYRDIDICGHSYSPATALYCVDEDAYHEEMQAWAESQAEYYRDEYEHDLRNMNDGESDWFNGYKIECIEKDDDEDEEDESEEQSLVKMQEEKAPDWNEVFNETFTVRKL